ncbi:hypothetical protein NHQ30_009831 [Ciborinia camelliae]|nr:hypothetical protein NHQ30_009831 [Ciborinia camelliae]
MRKMHSKGDVADVESVESAIDNTIDLRSAYDEAIKERKESERSLGVLKAVHDGNFTALKILLCQGADITKTTDTGKNALHVAASNGRLEMIKLLLKTNLDRNAKDTSGRSALHDAARYGHIDVLRELVAAGLSLSSRDKNDEDPLCEACRSGHQDIVQEILRIKALANPNRDTPQSSAQTELPNITQSLTPENSKVKDISPKKYIKLSMKNGYSAIAEIILAQHTDSDEELLVYTLKKAATMGDHRLIVSILKQKDRLLVKDTFYALGLAATHNHIPIMETMFENGTPLDPTESMDSLRSPLLCAIIGGHDDAVHFLIEKGANPNAQSGRYRSLPLSRASSLGNIAIVTRLLKAGADVNARSGYDGTALQEAAKEGHEAIVASLLEAGADINAPANYWAKTALQEAARKGHEAIVALLLKAGADINAPASYCVGTVLQEAAKQGNQTIMDMLLLAGADFKVPANSYCGTPLQEAVKNGSESMVKKLIGLGVDVNAPAVKSWRRNIPEVAIREALKKGNQAIVDMLIEAGAVDPQSG